MEEVPVTGIDFSLMNSMCSAISYLIATDGETVYWSSPLDNNYFAPDGTGDQAGAGATKILAVRGKILHLQTNTDGFYIITDDNVKNEATIWYCSITDLTFLQKMARYKKLGTNIEKRYTEIF